MRRGVCGAEHRDAVIKMCMIHLVRSEDYRDGVLRVLDRFEPQAMSGYPSNAELHSRFRARTGQLPPPGYVEYLVANWMNRQRGGAAFFERRPRIVSLLLRPGRGRRIAAGSGAW